MTVDRASTVGNALSPQELARLELLATALTAATTLQDVADLALAQALAPRGVCAVRLVVAGEGARAGRSQAGTWTSPSSWSLVETAALAGGAVWGPAREDVDDAVAVLPLTVQHGPAAALAVLLADGERFAEVDRRYLHAVAGLCAPAVRRLLHPDADLAELPAPPSLALLADPRRLSEVQRLGLLERSTRTNLDRLTALAARLLGGTMAQISIIGSREHVVSVYGLPRPLGTTPVEKTICSLTTAGRRPLRIEGAAQHPWVSALPPVRSGKVNRYLGVPVVSAGGEAVGALCVFDDGRSPWPDDGEAVLTELAAAVVTAAEFDVRSTLLEGALDRAARLQRVAAALGSATTHDEARGVLAQVQGEDDLQPELGELATQTLERVRLHEELREATDQLQSSLLPSRLPDPPGLEIAAAYLPADTLLTVGGDFYDAWHEETADAEHLWLTIGDVCGKGAGAAALTGLARHTLRAVSADVEGPAAALARLNRAMLHATGDASFCTALVLRTAPTPAADGTLRVLVAAGGHPQPLVLRRSGDVETVPVRGDLVGVWPQAHYRQTEVVLGPGDLLLLHTDGVTEARGPEGFFGEDGLRATVAVAAGRSGREVIDRVTAAVAAFRSATADDVALLALGVHPPGR